jgi:hypothetical protein
MYSDRHWTEEDFYSHLVLRLREVSSSVAPSSRGADVCFVTSSTFVATPAGAAFSSFFLQQGGENEGRDAAQARAHRGR